MDADSITTSLSEMQVSSSTVSQAQLQQFLESRQHQCWAYAIFWRPSTSVLRWESGHLIDSDRCDATDIEWFYTLSLGRSYSVGDATLAPSLAFTTQSTVWLESMHALHSSGCARAREGADHGIETMVWVPISGGVLELGSPELVPESSTLVDTMSLTRKRARGYVVGCGHVEAERLRREKLNRRFYELRSTLPTVKKMDRASLLAETVSYIKQLRARVQDLEAERTRVQQQVSMLFAPTSGSSTKNVDGNEEGTFMVEVRVLGSDEVLIRVESNGRQVKHPAAKLMGVLMEMEAEVQHAIVSQIRGLIVQDIVVKFPRCHNFGGGDEIRGAILSRLQQQQLTLENN